MRNTDCNRQAEADTKSEGTDIDEPFSPSAREMGFNFNKNVASAVSALAPSPPERLSPTKEKALNDDLSPVTELPNDIKKLRFKLGSSPTDFISEEPEQESEPDDNPLQSDSNISLTEMVTGFKPIHKSCDNSDLKTSVNLHASNSELMRAHETDNIASYSVYVFLRARI